VIRRVPAILLLVAAVPCSGRTFPVPPGATGPATRAAEWGQPQAGLQASLAVSSAPAVGGNFTFQLAARNAGQAPVELGPADKSFAWLFVAQGAEKAFYTEKVFPAEGTRWPAELAAGAEIAFASADLSRKKAYGYQKGMKLAEGYPSVGAGSEVTLAGALNQVLSPGKAKARLMLYIPRRGEPALLLVSNTVEFAVAAPDLGSLSAEARKAFVADLMDQFRKDAWSAQQAHMVALKLGRDIVPDLAALAGDPKAQSFTLMWVGTALADIGGSQAARTLIKLLSDPRAGVPYVVAYHGVKVRNAALDAAILDKAKSGNDPVLGAWAVRGFWTFRTDVPESIIDMGIASEEPRARAAAAEALTKLPAERALPRLLGLLKDKAERVRAAAAASLGKTGSRATEAIASLIAALDLPGEEARRSVCAALEKLTGRQGPYDPQADESTRQGTIRAWKDWWAKRLNRGD